MKHSSFKLNRENFENNDIDLKSENTEIVGKKKKFKNNNNRAKSNYKKETTNIEIKVNNFNPESDQSFNYYFNDREIYAKYTKKSQSKNFIYFECSKKRNGCNGIIRYEKNTKKLIIKNECLNKIKHDTITFDKFLIDFQNDNTNFYNMKMIKIQKFYVRYLFKTNQSNNTETIKSIFKNKYKFPIDLSNTQINYEKHKAFGTINSLDLYELCQKISTDDLKINVKALDVFYEYEKKKNEKIKREEKLIFITSELMEVKLKDNNIDNYFADVTYKIVPKFQLGYKLLTITGIDNNNENSYICALILIRYEDENSFNYVFKYLSDMYGFNPKNIHKL